MLCFAWISSLYRRATFKFLLWRYCQSFRKTQDDLFHWEFNELYFFIQLFSCISFRNKVIWAKNVFMGDINGKVLDCSGERGVEEMLHSFSVSTLFGEWYATILLGKKLIININFFVIYSVIFCDNLTELLRRKGSRSPKKLPMKTISKRKIIFYTFFVKKKFIP